MKVVFLESIEGIESLFTRGLREGAEESGWGSRLVFLRSRDKKSRPHKLVQDEILKAKPDLICFLMDAPLDFSQIWDTKGLRGLPKFSFWFDDFYRSPLTLKSPEIWRRWQGEFRVQVFIWDGFWRKRWKDHTGGDSRSIHLASSLFWAKSPISPLFPELEDYAVMVGTIPSRASFERENQALPSPIQSLLTLCYHEMKISPWPLRPYQTLEKALGNVPSKIVGASEKWLKNPDQQALLNRQLWRWGKRVARLRGLVAAGRTGPVAVLSGHHLEEFAAEAELKKEVGPSLFFRDTTEIPAQQWPGLFRSGRFQLQFMDPQSIEGGVPFRVFEATASGAALLSDSRPELEGLFSSPTECLLAGDETDLEKKCAWFRGVEKEELRRMGEKACRRFLAGHTWSHRWRGIASGL